MTAPPEIYPRQSCKVLTNDQMAFFVKHRIADDLLFPRHAVVHPYAWAGHLPFARVLVRLLKPSCIVELGAHTGNSFLGFCQAVKDNDLPCSCYAVDTWEGDENSGYYGCNVYHELHKHVRKCFGDFATLLRTTFDSALERFPDGSVDLLHIDGLHTYDAVKKDFDSWRKKLSRRAVVLFHDTAVRDRGFGVSKLWDELQARYSCFEFTHSHGLGVLLASDEVCQEVKTLIDLARANPPPIRELFASASLAALDGAAFEYQAKLSDRFPRKPSELYCELFIDDGLGFREELKLIANACIDNDVVSRKFDIPLAMQSSVVKLRIDPGVGPIAIRDISVSAIMVDGVSHRLAAINDSAVWRSETLLVFYDDPWLEFSVAPLKISSVTVSFHVVAGGQEVMRHLKSALDQAQAECSRQKTTAGC